MSETPRLCPHCRAALNSVQAWARTGYFLQLDQCAACGGLWCDKWELFPISSDQVEELDPVDRQALRAPTRVADEPGKCPQCNIALRAFTDPLLPADLRIERCPLCEGLWLNAGALRQFDQHRRRGQAAPRAQRMTPEAADRLARHLAAPATWSTTRNLGGVTDRTEPPDEDGELVGAVGPAVLWLALRTLLRLILHV